MGKWAAIAVMTPGATRYFGGVHTQDLWVKIKPDTVLISECPDLEPGLQDGIPNCAFSRQDSLDGSCACLGPMEKVRVAMAFWKASSGHLLMWALKKASSTSRNERI